MTTVISPNLKHTRDRIDPSGNIIHPRTKQIIQPVETPYVPPVVQAPVEAPYVAPTSPLTIQQQIDEAKANLVKLEELKKLKIAEMEAQLELLKS